MSKKLLLTFNGSFINGLEICLILVHSTHVLIDKMSRLKSINAFVLFVLDN